MKRKYTKKQIVEAISYWKAQLKNLDKPVKSSRQIQESNKISDFFGKLFKTKKFIAKQAAIDKQKDDAEFRAEHPLIDLAKKMNAASKTYAFRFTNADIENDGYPIDVSRKTDCIAVRYIDDYENRYDQISNDKEYIMEIARKCGLGNGYEFYPVKDHLAVIISDLGRSWYLKNVNESADEFERIDDIVKWCKDKNVKWREIYKTAPVKILRKPKPGESIKTVASDGTDELINKAKGDDWVVCNTTNEKNFWLVREKVLKSDYLQKDGSKIDEIKEGAVYTPKTKSEGGNGRLYAPISDYSSKGVQFAPPKWGGSVISVKNNGYFMQVPGDEEDIYGISVVDFDTTYRPTSK